MRLRCCILRIKREQCNHNTYFLLSVFLACAGTPPFLIPTTTPDSSSWEFTPVKFSWGPGSVDFSTPPTPSSICWNSDRNISCRVFRNYLQDIKIYIFIHFLQLLRLCVFKLYPCKADTGRIILCIKQAANKNSMLRNNSIVSHCT